MAVAPVLYYIPGPSLSTASFQFDERVELTALPKWMRSEDLLGKLGMVERRRLEHHSRSALIARSENFHDPGAVFSEESARLIWHANLAVWLAAPNPFAFEVIVLADEAEVPPRPTNVRTYARIPRDPCSPHRALSRSELEQARRFFAALVAVPDRGSVSQAISTLRPALTDDYFEIRLILLWISLEALFGPEDGQKIRKRLPQRLAAFVGDEEPRRDQLVTWLRERWDVRCNVVHGLRGIASVSIRDEVSYLQHIARCVWARLLIDPTAASALNGPEREAYLDGLLAMSSAPP